MAYLFRSERGCMNIKLLLIESPSKTANQKPLINLNFLTLGSEIITHNTNILSENIYILMAIGFEYFIVVFWKILNKYS